MKLSKRKACNEIDSFVEDLKECMNNTKELRNAEYYYPDLYEDGSNKLRLRVTTNPTGRFDGRLSMESIAKNVLSVLLQLHSSISLLGGAHCSIPKCDLVSTRRVPRKMHRNIVVFYAREKRSGDLIILAITRPGDDVVKKMLGDLRGLWENIETSSMTYSPDDDIWVERGV